MGYITSAAMVPAVVGTACVLILLFVSIDAKRYSTSIQSRYYVYVGAVQSKRVQCIMCILGMLK